MKNDEYLDYHPSNRIQHGEEMLFLPPKKDTTYVQTYEQVGAVSKEAHLWFDKTGKAFF